LGINITNNNFSLQRKKTSFDHYIAGRTVSGTHKFHTFLPIEKGILAKRLLPHLTPLNVMYGYYKKQPGHEADHSPPSSANVKNSWSYNSTAPICLHGMVLG
jgi:hypothetical protein